MSDPGAPNGPGGDTRRFVDDARRYALDSRIATGGMGEVWRGTDTVLGRDVAIKLLKAEYADDATFRSRFETEARHAASLLHPGVAAVYDFGEADPSDGSDVQRPYLVMELVAGEPLSALLAGGRPLDAEVTRDLMAQAADAIGAAHVAGIVHRDVKPANLLVTPDRQVKITDFGIARATEGMALTETGQVMGTPQYLSPEQAQGGAATPASDVYSLGVVAFECLAGERPFVRETAVATALAHLREPVPELPEHVPADLATVVRRAMAKSPEERFPDATAFAAALRDPSSVAPLAAGAGAAAAAGAAGAAAAGAEDGTQVMGAVPPPVTSAAHVQADPSGTGHRAARPGRSVPWAWILLAVAVVAGIVLVAVLASGNEDEPDVPTPTQTEKTKKPRPSEEPTTEAPSESASQEPSQEPSPEPSEEPSQEPSEEPSETVEPSLPTETASSQSQEPSPSGSSSPASQTSPSTASSASPSAVTSQSAAPSGGATVSGEDAVQ